MTPDESPNTAARRPDGAHRASITPRFAHDGAVQPDGEHRTDAVERGNPDKGDSDSSE